MITHKKHTSSTWIILQFSYHKETFLCAWKNYANQSKRTSWKIYVILGLINSLVIMSVQKLASIRNWEADDTFYTLKQRWNFLKLSILWLSWMTRGPLLCHNFSSLFYSLKRIWTWHMLPLSDCLGSCRLLGIIKNSTSSFKVLQRSPTEAINYLISSHSNCRLYLLKTGKEDLTTNGR